LDQLTAVERAFKGDNLRASIHPYLLAGSYLRQEILRGAKLKRLAGRRFTGNDHTASDINGCNRATGRRNRRWAFRAIGWAACAGTWLGGLGHKSDGKP
jgi:hypothetical protein